MSKQIVSIFDVDNTLVQGLTGRMFVDYLCKSRLWHVRTRLKVMCFRGLYHIRMISKEDMVRFGSTWYAGMTVDEVKRIAHQCFEQNVAPSVYQEGWDAIQLHQSEKHVVILASASTQFIIEPLAVRLGINDFIGTRTCVDGDILINDIEGPLCFKHGKRELLMDYLKLMDVDWDNSYAYSDSLDDKSLLEMVGNPRVINPNRKFANFAETAGWMILEWNTVNHIDQIIPSSRGDSRRIFRGKTQVEC